MQKGNYLRKISLVVTYEKYILFWQAFNIFGTFYPEPVKYIQAGVGDTSHQGIYKGPYKGFVFQFIN